MAAYIDSIRNFAAQLAFLLSNIGFAILIFLSVVLIRERHRLRYAAAAILILGFLSIVIRFGLIYVYPRH